MTDRERLKELARAVMDASMLWFGEDEKGNLAPGRARTLAGLALADPEPASPPGPRGPAGPLERPREEEP